MAGTSRRVDFLHLHANVSRRVRNLETGVHPTSSDPAYADVIPPTDITITNPNLNTYMAGTGAALSPQWQRRFGVVTMLGGTQPTPNWAALGAEETLGVLPAAARPLADMIFNGAMRGTPYVCQFRVQVDGTVSILKPAGAAGTEGVRFEGANWTND